MGIERPLPDRKTCEEYTAGFVPALEGKEAVYCEVRGPGLSGHEISHYVSMHTVDGILRALARAYAAGKKARSQEILDLLGGKNNGRF